MTGRCGSYEETGFLDTRTEYLIPKVVDTFMKNRTFFGSAHHLSAIMNANLILIMKRDRNMDREHMKDG